MSEYWVSKKKYFCKYCEIYIADDAPSRQQHENGLRHKGNLDRFIRGLYKAGEQRKKDEIEEKRELSRLEQAAQAAYAQDIAAGCARPGAGPVASVSTVPKKPAPKPSNPYTNYSTAASLGYSDPDVQRLAAETERRRTQGVVGEWEVVSTITPTPAVYSDDGDEKPDVGPPMEATAAAGVKREAEAPADTEDTRSFKLRKKVWGLGLSGGYDPDSIPIKLKKNEVQEMLKSTPESTEVMFTSVVTPESSTTSTGTPKWTKVQWKRASETTPDVSTLSTQLYSTESSTEKETSNKTDMLLSSLPMKDESDDSAVPLSLIEEVKADPVKLQEPSLASEISATNGMFRKRKTPGGNRGRRS